MNPVLRILVSALRDAFEIVGIGYTVIIAAQLARESLHSSLEETLLSRVVTVILLALAIVGIRNYASEGKAGAKK
jgi:hypothetical protein